MNDFEKGLVEIYPSLLKYAKYLTKNNIDEAKDLTQSTMLVCLLKEGYYKSENLRGWAGTVMHNVFINNLRAIQSHKRIIDANAWDLHKPPLKPDTEMGIKDLHKWVEKISNPQIKTPLQLKLEGYSYDDIGKMLGIPMHTVKARISWCRRQLKAAKEKSDARLKGPF